MKVRFYRFEVDVGFIDYLNSTDAVSLPDKQHFSYDLLSGPLSHMILMISFIILMCLADWLLDVTFAFRGEAENARKDHNYCIHARKIRLAANS